jgi:nitrogen regulatory protein P-II 1
VKKVEAIIRNSKLEVVKEALVEQGVQGMTISEVHGVGAQKGPKISYRGTEGNLRSVPRVKLETIVPDDVADRIVDVIFHTAHTGEVGDGRIYVSEIESVTRIRTGEMERAEELFAGSARR